MHELDIAVREFLAESYENLDQLERDLVTIEDDPLDRPTLDRIFRTIHSIKGSCGFLAYPRLEAVAHAGEGLLCRLREGELAWRPDITSALLTLADAMRTLLTGIEANGDEGEPSHASLIARLIALQDGSAVTAAAPSSSPLPLGEGPGVRDPASPVMIEDGLNGDRSTGHGPLPGGEGGRSTPGESPEEAPTSAISSGNIRVDVGLLDRLMNLVGELVLARNQILQHASSRGDLALMGTSRRLDLITTELQEGVMKTRMQPIGNIWSTLPRVVRDLSLICGKQVRVEMEGNETELDRTIIESIKDPLTHLVRNAIDHGIETPEERIRRGKAPAGCLRLRAFHESGQVIIEIADDGAGLDVDRITRRALERGIITREQSARRSDHELMQLIFLPGFSTAEKVTNVSGRGVGMDVVRTNIEKIGGTIEMTTRPGQGTSFKVKIPLTLAIIPALIVSAGGESFAIPQVNLLELVRLERDQARRAIETIRGAAIFRLRGDLLPLVRLDQMLGLGDANRGTGGGRMLDQFDAVNIVVLQTDGRRFGLVVDAINDTEEIVVKPLGKQLKGLSLFAGATIMGDGRVSLILDASGIAQRAGVVSATGRAGSGRDGAGSKPTDEPKTAYLLLRQGDEGRAAIPLSHVARLEEIPLASIEYSADREVVQYRERILPLVRLSRATGRGQRLTDERSDPMQVVVYTQGGLSVGLVVDEILDIIEDAVQVKPIRSGRGLLGTAVIHHRVTDVLDIPDLIRATDPELACVGTGSGD